MKRWAIGLLAGTFLAGAVGQSAIAADLVIWWNKSYYQEEDDKFDEIIKSFEAAKGIDVEYSLFTNEDVPVKVLAAISAGEVPDLAFGFLFDLQHTSRWAYEGRLVDVSDVLEPMADRFMPVALDSVNLLNGQTGERSYYAFPTQQQTAHIHVWRSLLEDIGESVDNIPGTWDEFWQYYCDQQSALRQSTGNRNFFGVGQPMSSSASDTIFHFMIFANAYGVEWLDGDGNAVLGEHRQELIDALDSYVMPVRERCNPPGAVDSDNNVNFLNQVVLMTPNPSMSIPASQYTQNPENYTTNIASIEWPDKPNGEPIVYMTAIKTAVILEGANNVEGAKDFMRFLYEPENFGPYLEGSIGRWFPVMPELVETPFWQDDSDPHRRIHRLMYMERPQNPFPFVYNHRFMQIMTENAIGKAVGRIVLENWSTEDAADELIQRVADAVGS
jgi:multiple sugar transport system substrate-binding protein